MTSPYRTAEPLTFACCDCGRRWHAAIDCGCGAGPLLDLAWFEVREMIVAMDDRRAESHRQKLRWAGVAIGMLGALLLFGALPHIPRIGQLPGPFSVPIEVLLVTMSFAVLATKLCAVMFPAPRKFPELVVSRGQLALPAKLLAPRRATIVTVALVVAGGAGVIIATPVVRCWSSQEGADHRRDIATRYEQLVDCIDQGRQAAAGADWTASCKSRLDALYSAVDNRSNDAVLRSTLEQKFRCDEKCDAKQLEKHCGTIDDAQRAMGLLGRSPVPH